MSKFWSSLGSAVTTGIGGALGGLPGALVAGGVNYMFNSMAQNPQTDKQLIIHQ